MQTNCVFDKRLVHVVLLSVLAFATGCNTDVASTNPFDPDTPPDKQAKAVIIGTVLGASPTGGDSTLISTTGF